MILANEFNITYNRKKIQRIMRKFEIYCPIRKANPYKRMAKATKELRVVPNVLNREFKQEITQKVLLTYIKYGVGQTTYLSTIKDSNTNRILAYKVSDKIDFKSLQRLTAIDDYLDYYNNHKCQWNFKRPCK